MRVLCICGSPRPSGNTEIVLRSAIQIFENDGLETEFLSVGDRPVKPCIACRGCVGSAAMRCTQPDPAFEGVIEAFDRADGVLVGSPVYFGSATPQTMAVLDRVGYVARTHPKLLKRKVGAAIAVARRAGHNFTFAQLNFFFLISEMIVPGSTYWNIAFGLEKGTVAQDSEGMATVANLARNMAWLIRKVRAD